MKDTRRHFGIQKPGILLAAVLFSTTAWSAQLTIRASQPRDTIAPEIYGHFAEHLGRCIYDGIWVGEDSPIPNIRGIRLDVLEALKALQIPVLRWPGGCFADEYHWKEGIGPRQNRPSMVNTHWGMVTETNAFGTHEFLDLCELLGCEAYVAGNVGSGTVEEMQDWVEYMTFDGISEMANLRRANGREKPWKVRYFGIGNENWGCGGNMTPEYYSDLYKRYATYVRNYSGNQIVKIACGPGGIDYHWTEVVMKNCHRHMDALAQHYYVRGTGTWGQNEKGSATQFDEKEWFALMKNTLEVDEVIRKVKEIMDKYDSRKRIALFVDEWGTWWDAEPGTNPGFLYQQNTLRDALSAGLFLNIFNQHCDRVRMANIAQTVNVLQAMILTEGEKMVVTPTYHVFEMYKVHQGGRLLPVELTCEDYRFGEQKLPALHASASKGKDGAVYLSVCNLNPNQPAPLNCSIEGFQVGSVSGRVLTAESMQAHNTFDKPNAVKPVPLEGIQVKDGKIRVTLPARCVAVLKVVP